MNGTNTNTAGATVHDGIDLVLAVRTTRLTIIVTLVSPRQTWMVVCETSGESGHVESNESNENPNHPTRAIAMGKFESPIVDDPIDDPLHQRTRRQMPTIKHKTNTILEESYRPPQRED